MKKIILSLLMALSFNLSFMTPAFANHHGEKAADKKASCDGKSCSMDGKTACTSCKAKKMWHGKKPQMDHTQFYLRHAKDLKLNADQIKSLETKHVAYAEQNKKLHADWAAKKEAFNTQIHEKKTSESSIKKHAKDMGTLKTKMLEHRLLHQYHSSKVLTDEQNTQVWDLMKAKKEKRKDKRGKKMKRNRRNKRKNRK